VGIDSDFWRRRRVLVTGHTGFKGAWLSLWLQSLGAEVTGLAPGPPTSPSLYELAAVGGHMRERALDVRDAPAVREAFEEAKPEVVLHLAAQATVRESLRDPLGTYQVNVIGTASVLEAVRTAGSSVRAVVVVTSDKCYENRGTSARSFAEGDPLGGDDPYSSSKACAEIVTAAYRSSYFRGVDAPRVASARAGNVVGGGDWGADRLLPDIVRAVQGGRPVRVRNPQAVRPWQHVLNPLSGYLLLAEELWRADDVARAWNFGPHAEHARTVRWVVETLAALWGDGVQWEPDAGPNPPEAERLSLDSTDAERRLGWRPGWGLEQALQKVVEWHQAERGGADMRRLTLGQIEAFPR
jgi:CDP-glucose 4,6-dehydratase